MESLIEKLELLKKQGCTAVKVSFEDEGALLNEVISMRKLTSSIGVELSVKIGGCEAKRDIVECMDLDADTIVAPMIESEFSLNKFLKSLSAYNYDKKKGFNLETIGAYKNLESLEKLFDKVDFVTVGRVDFVSSMNKDRDYVDTEEMYKIVSDVFTSARNKGTCCYLGGAVSINSKTFITNLINSGLLDKFETRYIIYDVSKINIEDFEKLLYWGNVFEVEWLRYISTRYFAHANKDTKRIKMIDDRISMNKINF